jgi:hypothetical protein
MPRKKKMKLQDMHLTVKINAEGGRPKTRNDTAAERVDSSEDETETGNSNPQMTELLAELVKLRREIKRRDEIHRRIKGSQNLVCGSSRWDATGTSGAAQWADHIPSKHRSKIANQP